MVGHEGGVLGRAGRRLGDVRLRHAAEDVQLRVACNFHFMPLQEEGNRIKESEYSVSARETARPRFGGEAEGDDEESLGLSKAVGTPPTESC